MEAIICPWCQTEIMQEEGQEPDKICPICDNEFDGYRTLKLSIGGSEEDDDDEDEDIRDQEEARVTSLAAAIPISMEENMDWEDDAAESDEVLRFEETVAQLVDEQELVPECPLCHEYMLEAGEQIIAANQFRPRIPDLLSEPLIEAPFTLTLYACPNCFTVNSFLSDSHRHEVVQKLSQERPTPVQSESGL